MYIARSLAKFSYQQRATDVKTVEMKNIVLLRASKSLDRGRESQGKPGKATIDVQNWVIGEVTVFTV